MRNKIRQIIESNLTIFSEEVEFSDDDNIFRNGFVDSLFAVQLIAYLEDEFGIKVDNADLDINNFCSVDRIVEFVERKQQPTGTAGSSAG